MSHGHGHRWTNEEIVLLMKLWNDYEPLETIAEQTGTTKFAVQKKVVELRQLGMPLIKRRAGHRVNQSDRYWTQADVEFLVRRRNDGVTAEKIGNELGRSPLAVHCMLRKLAKLSVPVKQYGAGRQRKWSESVVCAMLVADGYPTEAQP